jgi:hypothetical protein
VADQIPDFLESNDECSQSGLSEWTDSVEYAFDRYENFAEPLSSLFESSCGRIATDGNSNTSNCINPSLLTKHAHEPQNGFLSGLDQYTKETPADNSQPQIYIHMTPYGVKQSIPAPTSSTKTPSKATSTSEAAYPSPFSPPPLEHFIPQPARPAETVQILPDVSDGKLAIQCAPTSFVCKTCTRSFSTRLRYDRHTNGQSCQALFKCKHCRQSFRNAKDLKRHQGSSKALSSCLARKDVFPQTADFACICSTKNYTRKDSVVRHLRMSKTGSHCCRACRKNPCKCP